MVSLGTVVDSAGLMLVDTPSTHVIEAASRRNARWRDVEVTGHYLVDGLISNPHPLPSSVRSGAVW